MIQSPRRKPGTPGVNIAPRAMHLRYRPTTRCPIASAPGFYSRRMKPVSNANRFNKSPRRKPGDSGCEHRPA